MEQLTDEEIRDLINRSLEGDGAAENYLVSCFFPLVRAVAGRYFSSFLDLQDLQQVGSLGLLKAMRRYDPGRGTRFSTFAVSWIKGEILNHLRQNKELPARGSCRSFNGKSSGEAEGWEWAGKCQFSPSREELVVSKEFSGTVYPHERIEESSSPEMVDEKVVQKVWLKQALKELDGTARKVIFLRFFQEKTQEETGEIMGISQRQVSRLEKKVLSRMKEKMCR